MNNECASCGTIEGDVRLLSGAKASICVVCINLHYNVLEKEPRQILRRVKDELNRLVHYNCDPVPYSVISKVLGFPDERSREFGKYVQETIKEDHEAGRPLLAALVINKKKGTPGKIFFEYCRELGYEIPLDEEGEFNFWSQQIQKLNQYHG